MIEIASVTVESYSTQFPAHLFLFNEKPSLFSIN
jgi:hypothetical protein